jgi:hypothetical protein
MKVRFVMYQLVYEGETVSPQYPYHMAVLLQEYIKLQSDIDLNLVRCEDSDFDYWMVGTIGKRGNDAVSNER